MAVFLHSFPHSINVFCMKVYTLGKKRTVVSDFTPYPWVRLLADTDGALKMDNLRSI